MDTVTLSCRDCRRPFDLGDRERLHHIKRGDKIPVRCKDCRARLRAARANPEIATVTSVEAYARYGFGRLASGESVYLGSDRCAADVLPLVVGQRVLVVVDPTQPVDHRRRRAMDVKPAPETEEANA